MSESDALDLGQRDDLPGTRRLRFAPSPTGELHVGNVRTALFDYCLAGEGGRFLVRIEDTDRERYQPQSVAHYLETLAWLGLSWDEGPDRGGPCAPYVESERLPLYREAGERLLASGAAYLCFCSRERLEELRAAQRTAGLPTRYDGHCRNLDPKEASSRREAGEACVVRLRVPPGQSRWDDLVLGPQRFENETLDDQVLLKSDGFPTYHLAQVVDDHLMGITQVLRGVEWLPSTPKHLITYSALGWAPPEFAHVPLVLGQDHSKLSKRHGAQTVNEFRELGYLPEALVNFLAFLGWSPGTEEEVFSLPELRRRMSFERLQASPAVFDPQRLDHLNGVWIRRLPVAVLAERIRPFLPQAKEEQLAPLAAMIQERIRRLDEVPDMVAFAFREPRPTPTELAGKLPIEVAREFLERARERLASDDPDLVPQLRTLAVELGTRHHLVPEMAEGAFIRAAMQVLRLALTGSGVSPPLPDVVGFLGPDETMGRVNRALETLGS